MRTTDYRRGIAGYLLRKGCPKSHEVPRSANTGISFSKLRYVKPPSLATAQDRLRRGPW